ncbi:MAG: tetratricopeptide repeat protein [Thermomicrobiales bacterium]
MSDSHDLGNHGWAISTTSPDAQLWFDRGLNWTYGFNHEEAIRCFEQAIIAIPIARWRTGAWPTPPVPTTTSRGSSSSRRIWPRR